VLVACPAPATAQVPDYAYTPCEPGAQARVVQAIGAPCAEAEEVAARAVRGAWFSSTKMADS
jgi:predicted nucleic acid-binding Zn ribbon protein